MTTYFSIALLLLKIVSGIMAYLQRQNAIEEGQRQILAKELAAVASAAKIAQEDQTKVDGMTDAQVDSSLHDDFRP